MFAIGYEVSKVEELLWLRLADGYLPACRNYDSSTMLQYVVSSFAISKKHALSKSCTQEEYWGLFLSNYSQMLPHTLAPSRCFDEAEVSVGATKVEASMLDRSNKTTSSADSKGEHLKYVNILQQQFDVVSKNMAAIQQQLELSQQVIQGLVNDKEDSGHESETE